MKGYVSEGQAHKAAKRLKLDDLSGPGQECCPIQLPDGSFGYWTEHSHYHPSREPGVILVRNGRQIAANSVECEAEFGWEWIMNELGLTPPSFR
jgi:hypothetical protein